MSRDSFDRDRILGSVKNYSGKGLQVGLSTLGDFQKFLLRGNVVDLAVGVVIGAAFNGLVQAVVKDLLTPLIGLMGIPNFSDYSVNAFQTGNIFRFGEVINLTISFLITAAVVYFLVVKPTNILHDRYDKLRPKQEEAPTTRDCPFCLSTVPLAATRCAYCTAQIPPADDKALIGNVVPQR
jgi:large conductance mechanosensitive channel